MALLIVTTHVAPFAEDIGIPKLVVAGALSTVGVFSMVGRQAGFICDKIGHKKSLIIFCAMSCAAFLYLIVVQNVSMLYTSGRHVIYLQLSQRIWLKGKPKQV
jgi:MFS family permease